MRRRKNKINIPIFKVFAEIYAEDEYWKNIFINCSVNKFPKGIFYIPNVLYWRINNEKKSCDLPLDNQEAYKITKEIFSEILKPNDKSENKNKKLHYADKWKDMKSAHRNILLKEYIEVIVDKYSFSENEKNELYSIIIRYYSIKILKNEDFYIKNSKLVEIKGVKFTLKNINLPKLPKNTRTHSKKEQKLNLNGKIDFDKKWKTYVESV